MKLYLFLNRSRLLRGSYAAKFLFIAFLGIHIPLLGMIAYYLNKGEVEFPYSDFFVILLLTLVATGITLWVLNALLAPVKEGEKALIHFQEDRIIADLPSQQPDEAGSLMCRITSLMETIKSNEAWKEDVLSILSHDLRSPTSTVVTLAELINYSTKEEETKELSDHIGRYALQQLEMLEGILSLLRYNEGKIEKSAFKVSSILDIVLKGHDKAIRSKNLNVIVSGNVNHSIYGNSEMTTRILSNLISNAIKFSYQGGQIFIDIEKIDSFIEIKVRDLGKGFNKEIADQLLDRFTQASRQGTAGEVSTGIGLHLVNNFATRLGGTLSAYSEGDEKGALFTVRLPAA